MVLPDPAALTYGVRWPRGRGWPGPAAPFEASSSGDSVPCSLGGGAGVGGCEVRPPSCGPGAGTPAFLRAGSVRLCGSW